MTLLTYLEIGGGGHGVASRVLVGVFFGEHFLKKEGFVCWHRCHFNTHISIIFFSKLRALDLLGPKLQISPGHKPNTTTLRRGGGMVAASTRNFVTLSLISADSIL